MSATCQSPWEAPVNHAQLPHINTPVHVLSLIVNRTCHLHDAGREHVQVHFLVSSLTIDTLFAAFVAYYLPQVTGSFAVHSRIDS